MKTLKVFGVVGLILIMVGCSNAGIKLDKPESADAPPDKALTQENERLLGDELGEDQIVNDPSETQKNTNPTGEWMELEIDMEKAEKLQEQIDDGHRPGMMDPLQVAADFVFELEFEPKDLAEKIDSENHPVKDDGDAKLVEFEFKDGSRVEIRLIQPIRKKLGIWVVEAYRISKSSEANK